MSNTNKTVITLLPWQFHREHARIVRNGIALCNDVPLESLKDPEGGLVELKAEQKTKFNGKIFFKYLEDNGHDYASFHECKCGR